jgi:hypothetical protein
MSYMSSLVISFFRKELGTLIQQPCQAFRNYQSQYYIFVFQLLAPI